MSFLTGFLAALALFALLAVLRIRRFRRLRHARGGPGSPPRWMLRGLFRRLGTRPEQEQAIAAETDALAEMLRALREDGRALRAELAGLVGGPSLDAAALDTALRARVERIDALRRRLAEGLGRVHAVLDDAQRRALSELLLHGPGRHAHGCR
jgi:hypothetical protein